MAYAKEMTIATGHMVQVNGDTHEIKVSLTYELERDDHDVLLLAAVKAGEVQNAHKAACEQMHSLWTDRQGFTDEDAPPAHDEDDEFAGDEFGEEEEPPASAVPATFQPPPPVPTTNGQSINGNGRGNGFGKPAASNVTTDTEHSDKAASPAEEPCTTPQKIAIRSLAKQAGLDEPHLRDFLWDTFQTFRLEKLSKYQAARLMLDFKDAASGREELEGMDELGQQLNWVSLDAQKGVLTCKNLNLEISEFLGLIIESRVARVMKDGDGSGSVFCASSNREVADVGRPGRECVTRYVNSLQREGLKPSQVPTRLFLEEARRQKTGTAYRRLPFEKSDPFA